jgi:hypothetical protein
VYRDGNKIVIQDGNMMRGSLVAGGGTQIGDVQSDVSSK